MTNNKRKMNGLPMLRGDVNFGRRLERKIAKFEKKHPNGIKLARSRNPYFNPFEFTEEREVFLPLRRYESPSVCHVLHKEKIVITEDPDLLTKEMIAMTEELGYKVMTLSEFQNLYGAEVLIKHKKKETNA